MSESNAIDGYGTTFEVETAPNSGVYYELAEVVNVTPPTSTVDDIEVTHLQSPDRTKEYIPGLKDYSETPLTLNWIPGNDTDEFILDWEADGTRRRSRITYPNNVTDTFMSYVKGYTSAEINPAGKMEATLTVKVAGAKARGVAS